MKLGEPRIEVESCESTQELLDTSMPEGALALARFQTAGRGRLGRGWEAPAGAAILSSILLKPPAGSRCRSWRSWQGSPSPTRSRT